MLMATGRNIFNNCSSSEISKDYKHAIEVDLNNKLNHCRLNKTITSPPVTLKDLESIILDRIYKITNETNCYHLIRDTALTLNNHCPEAKLLKIPTRHSSHNCGTNPKMCQKLIQVKRLWRIYNSYSSA